MKVQSVCLKMLSAIVLSNQFQFSVLSHVDIIFPKSLRLLHSGGLQCIFFYLYINVPALEPLGKNLYIAKGCRNSLELRIF